MEEVKTKASGKLPLVATVLIALSGLLEIPYIVYLQLNGIGFYRGYYIIHIGAAVILAFGVYKNYRWAWATAFIVYALFAYQSISGIINNFDVIMQGSSATKLIIFWVVVKILIFVSIVVSLFLIRYKKSVTETESFARLNYP